MGGFQTRSGGNDDVVWEVLGDHMLNDPNGSIDLTKGLCFGFVGGHECGMWSSAAWWNNGNAILNNSTPYASYVYVAPEGSTYNGGNLGEIIQYTLCPGASNVNGAPCQNDTTQAALEPGPIGGSGSLKWPGITPVITTATEISSSPKAVLWALDNSHFASTSDDAAILYGYDAATLGNGSSFWDSASSQMPPGPAVKFTIPTVANGKIYIGGDGQLTVYKLN